MAVAAVGVEALVVAMNKATVVVVGVANREVMIRAKVKAAKGGKVKLSLSTTLFRINDLATKFHTGGLMADDADIIKSGYLRRSHTYAYLF